MKIVFFIQNMSRAGGSERVCSLVSNYLSKEGYNVTILSICGSGDSFFPLDEKILLTTLINKDNIDNRREFFSVIKKLCQFYRLNRPDLVIDVFPALSIYTILLKKLFGFKNISWEHYNYLNNSGMNKVGRKLAILYSDKIVTLTETDKSLYIAANPRVRSKIETIFNPTPFPYATIGKERERAALAIGRLEKQKGFHHLLDIWRLVEKELNDVTLYIIGNGEERKNLESQVKKNGLKRVVFTGKIRNVDEYYKHSMLLVSTSEHEGLPMTMIEAQSFGIPIVSYDYMTGPADIITNGKDGYIISGKTLEEKNDKMAKAIISFFTDIKFQAKMSENAKKSSKRFEINEIGFKWEKVIGELSPT